MQDTPIFYQKAHELGALLVRALEESDTDGKRRTLGAAWQLFRRYQEKIETYLKTPPEPGREPVRKEVLQRMWARRGLRERLGWIQQDLARRDQLKEEIRQASRETYLPI